MDMDVLTSETCWALNNEIIMQVTSSWSLFIQLFLWISYLNLNNTEHGCHTILQLWQVSNPKMAGFHGQYKKECVCTDTNCRSSGRNFTNRIKSYK